MKKYFLLFSLFTLFFTTCNDPIFYNISQEEKLLEPKIKGSPTNFVIFNGDELYVASGNILYRYRGSVGRGTGETNPALGLWDEFDLGEKIWQLAVTDTKFYALCEVNEKRVIKELNKGDTWNNRENWKTLSVYEETNNDGNPTMVPHNVINRIYTAENKLFIGAGEFESFYILINNGSLFQRLYFRNEENTPVVNIESRMLNGVVFSDPYFYFSTQDIDEGGGGIYAIQNNQNIGDSVTKNDNIAFMGIINIGGTVVAITRDGHLHSITPSSHSRIRDISLGNRRLATGALYLWRSPSGNNLLLAGRQDRLTYSTSSGYTYGYMEISSNLTGDFSEPGIRSGTVTLGENGRYRSTIGKIPINDIIQSPYPGEERILFASTQVDGIWSYRNRNSNDRNDWHWNAEQSPDS